MGSFSRLDPRRVQLDSNVMVGDRRTFCTVYRRQPGADIEREIGQFWGRISNTAKQTTGLESQVVGAGLTTSAVWVLKVPANEVPLLHGDEIRTDDGATRYRVIHVRSTDVGQQAVLSNIQ